MTKTTGNVSSMMKLKSPERKEEDKGAMNLKTYDLTDFKIGLTLGTGGFADVYEVWKRAEQPLPLTPQSLASMPPQQQQHYPQQQPRFAVCPSSRLLPSPAVTVDEHNNHNSSNNGNENDNISSRPSSCEDSHNSKGGVHAESKFLSRTCKTALLPQVDSTTVSSTSSLEFANSIDCSRKLMMIPKNDMQNDTTLSFSKLEGGSRAIPFPASSTLALKRLHDKTLSSIKKARMGIEGLHNEAKLLASLPRHNHIVTLYGVSRTPWPTKTNNATTSDGPSQNSNDHGRNSTDALKVSLEQASTYFLVLERLLYPLDRVLRQCQVEAIHKRQQTAEAALESSSCLKISLHKLQLATNAKKKALWAQKQAMQAEQERLELLAQQTQRLSQVGLPVAQALAFLHQHHILYRDLKPANVGFDRYGQLKLFDFGLARRLVPTTTSSPMAPRDNDNESNDYNNDYDVDTMVIQSRSGTLRYMAPEVANVNLKCQGFASDVYSFGMFLYEVLTLEKPYPGVTDRDELHRLVSKANFKIRYSNHSSLPTDKQYTNHPMASSLYKIVSPFQQELVQSCWREPPLRPTMDEIVQQLQTHIEEELLFVDPPTPPTLSSSSSSSSLPSSTTRRRDISTEHPPCPKTPSPP